MKKYYFERFDVSEKEAFEKSLDKSDGGIKTKMTEILGDKIIKKYHLWNEIFPNYQSVKKSISKKNQKEGIDYFITLEDDTVVTIDVKVCCGNSYDFHKCFCYKNPEKDYRPIKSLKGFTKKQAPIELFQYNRRTFTQLLKTDYILFIFADSSNISYCLMPYKDILSLVDKNIPKLVHEGSRVYYDTDRCIYNIRESNNGTGKYISICAESKIIENITI